MAGIYSYTDYREFLKDQLELKRRRNGAFSMRAAAARMGVGSGTLSRILCGTREIGPNLLPAVISFLGLKTREAEYFTLMAGLERSSSPGKKRDIYEAMLRLRCDMRARISQDQYRLFEEWYHLALHQLLRILPRCADPVKLGAMLDPPVSAARALKALDLLRRHGLVRRNRQGGYSPVNVSLTTGETWNGMAIHGFQKAAAVMAGEALDRLPREERDFSTLTLGLSGPGFTAAREILRRARQELLALDEKEKAPERVYQFNLQAFPLSRREQKQGEQS